MYIFDDQYVLSTKKYLYMCMCGESVNINMKISVALVIDKNTIFTKLLIDYNKNVI